MWVTLCMEDLSAGYVCFQHFECFSTWLLLYFVFYSIMLSYTSECSSKIISQFNVVIYFSFLSLMKHVGQLSCCNVLECSHQCWALKDLSNSTICMWQTWNSCVAYILRLVWGTGLYSALFIRDVALHSGLVHHQGLLETVKFFLCVYLCKVTCDPTIYSDPFFLME